MPNKKVHRRLVSATAYLGPVCDGYGDGYLWLSVLSICPPPTWARPPHSSTSAANGHSPCGMTLCRLQGSPPLPVTQRRIGQRSLLGCTG